MVATTTITSISRNFNGADNIVQIVTTANLATITTAGYLTNEDANIQSLNNGEFTWQESDIVLIYYATNETGWFQMDEDTATFVGVPANGGISNTLDSGEIIVGNSSNVATPVAMTGDLGISNTGLTTVQAGAITGSKIAANAVDYANLAADVVQVASVSLTAAQVNGMFGTPVLLLAAAGAGKLIVVQDIVWDVAFVSAAYAAGGVIAAQYGNTIHGAGPAASGTLAAATLNGVVASSFLSQSGSAAVLNVTKTASLNTAVYISNATAAFTTGDSTVTLYVRYRVITPA